MGPWAQRGPPAARSQRKRPALITPSPCQVIDESARVREIHDTAEVFDPKAETSFKYLQARPALCCDSCVF